MEQKLPPEYFTLIRDVLRAKQDEPERPLKRKRGRQAARQSEVVRVESSPEPEVIEVLSTDELFEEPEADEHEGNDDDYESDEFEDVTDPTVSPDPEGDISVSVEVKRTQEGSQKRTRNMVSNGERHWRHYFHMVNLLCLAVHGSVRNDWINNGRLEKKLCNLVPDNVLQLLHPEKDEEMPLRSTRRLLDGLKSCMEIWNKHWKIKRAYKSTGCYMKHWDEIKVPWDRTARLTKKAFTKQILKGAGDRDVAAQGFVALLRSCNINARLIMSLQPPDFSDLKVTETRTSIVSPATLFKYPIFWCEVWDKFSKKWITIDAINLKTMEQVKTQSKLEPRGTGCCQRNVLRYVVGFDRKKGCRDVTRRYSHWFNCKCIRKRVTKDSVGAEWYHRLLKRLHERKRTRMDDYEDEYFEQRNESEGMPDNIQDLKNHPRYVLEKDLKVNQIVKPGCKECGYLNVHHKKVLLKVYEKRDVLNLKSARQWYMAGRVLKVGSKSLKRVPKRGRSGKEEDEEQRLYSFEDTELYVPPLASEPEGKIAKNAFENIEVFTPSMIPANCILINSEVAVKAARLLQIEYARAVTAFSFEKGRTTKPVIGGVVVARWFKDALLCAVEGIENGIEQEERERSEVANLTRWNLLLMKLRIKNDLNATYGKVEKKEYPVETEEYDDDNRNNNDVAEGAGFLVASNGNVTEPPAEFASSDHNTVQDERYNEQPGNLSETDQGMDLENTEDGNDSYDEFMNELEMSGSE